jgi:hypothetical protein
MTLGNMTKGGEMFGRLFLVTFSCVALAIGPEPMNDAASSFTEIDSQAGVARESVPDVPMTVVSTQLSSDGRTVTFVVQNNSAKVVTAWDVAIRIGSELDAKFGGYGTDSYRSFAGLVESGPHIFPGGSITTTANAPSGSDAAAPLVVITSTAAVFADNSSAGDKKFADLVFQRRAVQLAAWQEITSELDQIGKSGTVDVANLELILSRLNASLAKNGPDIVRMTFRSNLSIAIADIRSGRALASAKLNLLLDDARRNAAAAAAHVRQ